MEKMRIRPGMGHVDRSVEGQSNTPTRTLTFDQIQGVDEAVTRRRGKGNKDGDDDEEEDNICNRESDESEKEVSYDDRYKCGDGVPQMVMTSRRSRSLMRRIEVRVGVGVDGVGGVDGEDGRGEHIPMHPPSPSLPSTSICLIV